jgi:hypothetical protein
MTTKRSLSFLAVLVLISAEANAETCEKKVYLDSNVKVTIDDDCAVYIDPQEDGGLNRSYSALPDGYFLVFIDDQRGQDTNSLGKNSKTTGSRTFHFLPAVSTKPQAVINGEGAMEVLSASGVHFLVGKNGELEAVNGEQVRAKSLKDIGEASREGGGFEINSINGLLSDYGWMNGGEMKTNLAGKSQLKDKNGAVCTVKNSEIFKKDPSNPFNTVSKYKDSKDWKGFLAARCKSLKWTEETYKTSINGTEPKFDPAFAAYLRARNR